MIHPAQFAKCHIKNPDGNICTNKNKTGSSILHDCIEQDVPLNVRYNPSKESGIQNLLTDDVIRQKVIFLTGFDSYFSYLIEYYVLIAGPYKIRT